MNLSKVITSTLKTTESVTIDLANHSMMPAALIECTNMKNSFTKYYWLHNDRPTVNYMIIHTFNNFENKLGFTISVKYRPCTLFFKGVFVYA